MSTQTTTHDKTTGAKEPDPHRLVRCPNCLALVHFDELEEHVPVEFPKLLYKEKPKETPEQKAAAEPPEVETIVVHDEEEEKKKTGEGWSKEPPKPKPAPGAPLKK